MDFLSEINVDDDDGWLIVFLCNVLSVCRLGDIENK